MADPRRVVWAESAARDLEEIVTFVARDSPGDAERLLAKLETRASALTRMPDCGRIVPEILHFGLRTWRELIVRPYRIVYRVSGRVVIVLAVLDGRRDLQDLLLERLVRVP
jgi:addiction module RelE/StbE family toxin